MNKYEIKVNNATIYSEGLNEVSAMKNLGIFAALGKMIDCGTSFDEDIWIYQMEMNGGLTLVYVRKLKEGGKA